MYAWAGDLQILKKNKWQTLDTSQRTKIKQDLTSKFNIDEDQVRRLLQRDHY